MEFDIVSMTTVPHLLDKAKKDDGTVKGLDADYTYRELLEAISSDRLSGSDNNSSGASGVGTDAETRMERNSNEHPESVRLYRLLRDYMTDSKANDTKLNEILRFTEPNGIDFDFLSRTLHLATTSSDYSNNGNSYSTTEWKTQLFKALYYNPVDSRYMVEALTIISKEYLKISEANTYDLKNRSRKSSKRHQHAELAQLYDAQKLETVSKTVVEALTNNIYQNHIMNRRITALTDATVSTMVDSLQYAWMPKTLNSESLLYMIYNSLMERRFELEKFDMDIVSQATEISPHTLFTLDALETEIRCRAYDVAEQVVPIRKAAYKILLPKHMRTGTTDDTPLLNVITHVLLGLDYKDVHVIRNLVTLSDVVAIAGAANSGGAGTSSTGDYRSVDKNDQNSTQILTYIKSIEYKLEATEQHNEDRSDLCQQIKRIWFRVFMFALWINMFRKLSFRASDNGSENCANIYIESISSLFNSRCTSGNVGSVRQRLKLQPGRIYFYKNRYYGLSAEDHNRVLVSSCYRTLVQLMLTPTR